MQILGQINNDVADQLWERKDFKEKKKKEIAMGKGGVRKDKGGGRGWLRNEDKNEEEKTKKPRNRKDFTEVS